MPISKCDFNKFNLQILKVIPHCKFQILWETDFLNEILKMRHLLLIMRKKTETTLNVSYFEKIMSH